MMEKPRAAPRHDKSKQKHSLGRQPKWSADSSSCVLQPNVTRLVATGSICNVKSSSDDDARRGKKLQSRQKQIVSSAAVTRT